MGKEPATSCLHRELKSSVCAQNDDSTTRQPPVSQLTPSFWHLDTFSRIPPPVSPTLAGLRGESWVCQLLWFSPRSWCLSRCRPSSPSKPSLCWLIALCHNRLWQQWSSINFGEDVQLSCNYLLQRDDARIQLSRSDATRSRHWAEELFYAHKRSCWPDLMERCSLCFRSKWGLQ